MAPKQSATADRAENDAYYTKHDEIDKIISDINTAGAFNDVKAVVDFSAGDGRFCRSLKTTVEGLTVYQYDVAPKSDCVIKRDWFTVGRDDIPKSFNVGLNPPFGHNASDVRRFIDHMRIIKRFPSFIFLIHPICYQDTITGYNTILSRDLPLASFERDGKPFGYKCRFSMFNRDASITKGVLRQVRSARRVVKAGSNDMIKFSRMWKFDPSIHNFIIRRAGVNFLRQCYIIRNGKVDQYVENGAVARIVENLHDLASEAFYKCIVADSIDLTKLAVFMTSHERSETDKNKAPPSTTNENMFNLVTEFIASSQRG